MLHVAGCLAIQLAAWQGSRSELFPLHSSGHRPLWRHCHPAITYKGGYTQQPRPL